MVGYHDSNAMKLIDYQINAFYIMDKVYLNFAALYIIEQAGAFFISRAKKTMSFSVVESSGNIDLTTGLRADQTIVLSGYYSKKLYPKHMRIVTYWDDQKNVELIFLTDNFEITAIEVARLYKNRWQIEVFFKWIKQNLTIKRLWGHSENAVHIHIWIALSTYLIVAYFKMQIHTSLSIYEIMQIIGISTFDKTPIAELVTETITNQNVNEQLNLFE